MNILPSSVAAGTAAVAVCAVGRQLSNHSRTTVESKSNRRCNQCIKQANYSVALEANFFFQISPGVPSRSSKEYLWRLLDRDFLQADAATERIMSKH